MTTSPTPPIVCPDCREQIVNGYNDHHFTCDLIRFLLNPQPGASIEWRGGVISITDVLRLLCAVPVPR